ncbi:hypothetical protein FQZ97_1242570 [compost metagenome]
MGEPGTLRRQKQRAVDYTAGVGGFDVRFDDVALEGKAIVIPAEFDAFEVAELAAQAFELAVRRELELECLANF